MKLLFFITLFISLALAAELSQPGLEERAGHPRKVTHRPKKYTGAAAFRAAKRPAGAPTDYKTGTDKPSLKMSKTGLQKLPSSYIDSDMRRRRESLAALRLLQRQSTANDFYVCQTASPAPSDSDCNVIIDQVYASNDNDLVISANSCLTFTYQTCEGFFCSLCETLGTGTDFIGNQLNTAEALCISQGGKQGTIIGEDAPQWDAGFVRAGSSLPTFDVC